MDNLLQELQEIFRDVLDQPDMVLTHESNASNCGGLGLVGTCELW